MTRAVRRRGGGATQLRFQWSQRALRDQAPFTNARPAKPVISVDQYCQTAGVSAAALARVDFAQRVTNQWRSPISSSKEVIAQTHPDSRLWGNLMAAGGEKLMTVHGEISWPPLGRST